MLCALADCSLSTMYTNNDTLCILQGETLGDAWLNFLMAESSDTSALSDATKSAAAVAVSSSRSNSSSAAADPATGKALLLARQGSSSSHTVTATPPSTT